MGLRLFLWAQAAGPPGALPAELAEAVDATSDEDLLADGDRLLKSGSAEASTGNLDLAIHLLDAVSALVDHRPTLSPGLVVGGRQLQVLLARAQGDIDLQIGLWRLLATEAAEDPLPLLAQIHELREGWVEEIGELRAHQLAGILAGADPVVWGAWIEADLWLQSPESEALLARAEICAGAALRRALGSLRCELFAGPPFVRRA